MAHPLYAAEEAVKYFVVQWLSGLQPTLHLTTKPDGSISVKSAVESYPVQVKILSKTPRHRSGHSARLRRKKERESRRNPTSSTITNVNVTAMIDNSTMTSYEKPKLSMKNLESIDISPEESPHLPKPKLSIVTQPTFSIQPRIIYHPAVVNACFAILGKHPSTLTPAEVGQFEEYKQFKAFNNDPIEDNVVYQPIGGVRICMHCENPT